MHGPIAESSPWEEGWHSLENSVSENRAALQRTLNSSSWVQMQRWLGDQVSTRQGLRAVELGCGRAVTSAALAVHGADVTLVDLSESALSRAREFFANNELEPPHCVVADVMRLPAELLGRFDLVCSFGLAEHFSGTQRLGVFEAHRATLRPGGCGIVSVPNRLYLPAQIYKFASERLGMWPYGFEKDFTRGELIRRGRQAGFLDCQTIGSEVLYDLYSHTFLKFPAFVAKIAGKRRRGPVTARYDHDGRYTMKAHTKKTQWVSPLDPLLGFSLTLLGRNP